jgi:hypothetical protein
VRLASLTALAAALAAIAAAGAPAAGPPALAVAQTGSTEVLDATGALVRTFGEFGFFSLAGNLFAGSKFGDKIVARDITTGAQRFTIKNAFGPIVLVGGRVAFLPDRFGRRDPQVNSVWIRGSGGKVRKLVQFSNGSSLPGIKTGLPDAGVPLGVSFDAAGRTLAVVEGNDVDQFFYDIWIVDVPTGAAFRATTGARSRFASLSPNGARLAFLREEGSCGGPPPGFRAGDLSLEQAGKGAPRTTLLDGSCALFYTEPRWVSGSTLAAIRLTRVAPGVYDSDLVLVDVATKTVTPLTSTGDVFGLSASSTVGLAAVMRGSGGVDLWDVDAATSVHVPGAFAPKTSGDRAWP